MTRFARSSLIMVAATIASVAAQPPQLPATPLASKRFPWPTGVPYQADPDDGTRGRQYGYNLCNSTTENQESRCQTAFLNHLDDFCLFAPPERDSVIGDIEHEAVAWCTKPGKGTRLIPEGTLQGVQYMRTPDYIQVVGYIDQTRINIRSGDFGGELDPHGADLRGNPLGGLVYSNAFPSNGGNNETYQQVIQWHLFIGSNQFCFKACDPAGANDRRFCEHIFDRIGCAYNAPHNAQNGTFERCEGENQDFPGIYTVDGEVRTYTQPPESLGPISTMPYQPRVPASSNCVQFASSALYSGLPTAPGTSPTTTSTSTSTGGSNTGATTRTGTNTAGGAQSTGEPNAARSLVMAGRGGHDNGGFAGAVIALGGVALTAMILL